MAQLEQELEQGFGVNWHFVSSGNHSARQWDDPMEFFAPLERRTFFELGCVNR